MARSSAKPGSEMSRNTANAREAEGASCCGFCCRPKIRPSVLADFSGEYTHRVLCLPKRHAISMASIILLNGATALPMLVAFALGFQSTEPKLVAAMLVRRWRPGRVAQLVESPISTGLSE